MTRREWLLMAVASLRPPAAGVTPPRGNVVHEESPRLCAELLLCAALGLDKLDLVCHPHDELNSDDENVATALLTRRLKGEPVAYLLGYREFYGREFLVTPATLIPRPETECLVDTALELLPPHVGISFADLGSGTGCIGVTLAAERPLWRGVGLDISAKALDVARANASTHGVGERLCFLHGDMADVGVLKTPCFLCDSTGDGASFDLVVSNPPYISEAEYAELEPDVRIFEPKMALVSGALRRATQESGGSPADGLALPAAAVRAAELLLRPGGIFLMEHGAGQGAAVRELCAAHAWEKVATVQDLAGRDRYVRAYRR